MSFENKNENSSVIFEPDFSAARLSDGTAVTFTRLEKRALTAFSSSAGRLMTRSRLLDEISEPGSEKNDRTVDFLINRLRTKLGDNAKSPRFIATKYGEGYVWLVSPQAVSALPEDAFIVLGPIKGTLQLKAHTGIGTDLAYLLRDQFQGQVRPDQKVVIVADIPSTHIGPGVPAIGVQLTFFQNAGVTECVVAARRFKSNRIFYVNRFPIQVGPEGYSGLSQEAQTISQRIMARHWEDIAETNTASAPLPVAMHEAAQLPTYGASWDDVDRRIRVIKEERPDDPSVKMMWATHLHTKYVMKGAEMFQNGTDTCAEDEAEIERLVLESLDFAATRPEYAVMAAKLLYFVDRGYRDQALDLALTAHNATSAVASSLSILGQLFAFTGNMPAAEDYLLQAELLSEPGSEFQIYALFMLCQAHMAAGNREKLAATLSKMYRIRPATLVVFEPIFSDPYAPSLRAKAIALMMSRARAVGLLKQVNYLGARLFENPEHRENMLLTPVNLFVRRFGPDVVPDEAAMHLSQFRARFAETEQIK